MGGMNPRPATATAAPATTPGQGPSPPRFPASLDGAVERAWRRAAAPADWNLTREEFQSALERGAAKKLAGALASPAKTEAYLDTLHARDLSLAVACANGCAAAWDVFMAEFRPELYRAARAIVGPAAGGEPAARELADSLFADLYGLRESGGRRKSLLEYFHGRSKLSTWLHAVLAQRHVDEIRRTRAAEPIEDQTGAVRAEVEAREAGRKDARGESASDTDPERARYLAALQAALAAALAALDPRDRLRLAYYYADGRTLAEIGRLLGEHEATVSRKLDRARRDIREKVEAWLREVKKWNGAQIGACLQCARGEWPFDLSEHWKSREAGAAGRKI